MKLTLRNGREVTIEAMPLDSSGDKLAELCHKSGEAENIQDARAALAELGVEAICMFNPDVDRKAALAGLNMENVTEIIACLKGMTSGA